MQAYTAEQEDQVGELTRQIASLKMSLPRRRRARIRASESPEDQAIVLAGRRTAVMELIWISPSHAALFGEEVDDDSDEQLIALYYALPTSVRDSTTERMRRMVRLFAFFQ